MKLFVLETKRLNGNKTWSLCRGNLYEYIEELKPDFFEFSIQRKIVSNAYLDSIYESILYGEPIPAITLTSEEPMTRAGDTREVNSSKLEILDGLQRTYRLWVISKILEIIKRGSSKDFKSLVYSLQSDSEGKLILQNSFVTPKFLRSLSSEVSGKMYAETLLDAYKNYDVYFNVWTGLSDEDVLRKMLVLNAGQKSVTSTHQYELMFLHYFDKKELTYSNRIELVRERDSCFRAVQCGNRAHNQYLMASVIVALQSFIHGRQMRIKPVNSINLDDSSLINDEIVNNYFSKEKLSSFIDKLDGLGMILYEKSNSYVKWYGKDTVLSGIFGAIGDYCMQRGLDPIISAIDDVKERLYRIEDPFKLLEYEDAYNTKAGNSNLGNVVRKAVFFYTQELLKNGESNWYKHFDKSKRNDEE